ncbi:NAD/NADP octopine/nopaline dehydrogenase family protein [Saccharomonospora piscinae]|uniref:NAD/NADP octopine/nopaline dehydrogenase family protein n=1 Tax=Saccharomonospora piscinae TaxID=687388 RepID=UPI000463FDBE|nr:NAD/NADP octopine/nopaline dehydrogenase family protein [Saccharomonospora piscinae]
MPRSLGVIGAGAEGLALAAYLSSASHRVHLYTRDPRRIAGVTRDGRIRARGTIEGEFPVSSVTDDIGTVVRRCSVMFVATVTTAYLGVARELARHLSGRHTVVLFSGKLCGCAEFTTALAGAGSEDADVIEMDALFAARPDGDRGVRVHGFKRWTLFSGLTQRVTDRHADFLREMFPGVEPAANVIERGLADFGAVAHAPITLANISRIDRGEQVLFYREGLSERTIVLLEALSAEFHAVGRAYSADVPPPAELLDLYYGGRRDGGVLETMRTMPVYRAIFAPTSLDHRMLREDVASTLVPLSELARRAGVPVPVTDAIVTFVSVLAGENYRSTGRTLARLGWERLSGRQILQRIQS